MTKIQAAQRLKASAHDEPTPMADAMRSSNTKVIQALKAVVAGGVTSGAPFKKAIQNAAAKAAGLDSKSFKIADMQASRVTSTSKELTVTFQSNTNEFDIIAFHIPIKG